MILSTLFNKIINPWGYKIWLLLRKHKSYFFWNIHTDEVHISRWLLVKEHEQPRTSNVIPLAKLPPTTPAFGHWFEALLFNLWSGSQLLFWGRQQGCVLPSTGESWTPFQVPALGLAQPSCSNHLGSELVDGIYPPRPSFSISHALTPSYIFLSV